MHRRRVAVAALLAVGVITAVAVPADASTSVTFTVTAGSLSITEPAGPVNLGSSASSVTGTTVTGSLGNTTVTDTRGSLAGWTWSVQGPTNFSDGATTPHTIPASAAVIYGPATITPTSGTAVVTNTHVAAATGLALSSTAQSFITATTTGSNTVTVNPTIQVTIASTVVAGTYSGTITQTVV